MPLNGAVIDMPSSGMSTSDFAAAVCVEADTALVVGSDDAALPLPRGEVRFYLVRVRNACGETLGVDSESVPRPAGASCSWR